jgi:uncharacterized membrane protein (UPF0127 family)
MKLFHNEVAGVKIWLIFLGIAATLIVMSVLLESPRLLKNSLGAKKGTVGLTDGRVKIDGVLFSVKIADTDEERRQGLSGSAGLSARGGMLFVFDENDQHGIWMKDMNYPIDVIWISENYNIVSVKKHINPNTYPQVFQNSKPARYVLELPAGSIDTYSINGLSQVKLDLITQ